MKRRLTLITEIIAPYRIPVFNALAKVEDIEPHVTFLSETDPSLRQWQIHKEEIRFEYEVLKAFRRRLGKFNFLINRGVAPSLKSARPDAILCGGYNYVASWQALFWARKRGVPFLLWLESTAADQRRLFAGVERLKQLFLAHCRGFVVPGRASGEYLRLFGVPPNKIFLAPNAIDNAFFTQRASQARLQGKDLRRQFGLPERYFLFVGRFVRAKGVFELLEAYAKLEPLLRQNLGLVFVGDGPAATELRERASKLPGAMIKFAGFQRRETLPAYYALADALVFPTHSDTWGFVVNEAMACSLPVIVSSVAGCVADLVKDGWNGRIVSSRDVPELTRALTEVAEGGAQLREMGERSARRIAEYSPEACAAGIAQAVTTCT